MRNQKIKILFTTLAICLSIFILVKLPFALGLDLQGGMQLVLEAQDRPGLKVDQSAIKGVLKVIQNRIDQLGVSEPIIRSKGLKQVVVELPGIKDHERAISLIGETAVLEFREAEWAPEGISKLSPEKIKILAGEESELKIYRDYDRFGNIILERPIFLKKTVLTGAELKNAYPETNNYGEPQVTIEFTSKGAKLFKEITTRSVKKPLAILLDDKIISAPRVSEPISSPIASITGSFSDQQVMDLAIKLKAGALPVPVKVISKKIIGPTLGEDSILKSLKAGRLGLILVVIFMLIYYRALGAVASIALCLYLVLTLAIFKLIPVTLTLPGLAGVVLTIGMAVDANVIIFERIKEEQIHLHSAIAGINKGFKRAFVAIVDANITTLIAAAVLFWLGTGTIKGFAVTLSIGILMSMFSALVITRLFLEGSRKLIFKKEID